MRQNMAATTASIINSTMPTITPAANPNFNIADWVKTYQNGVNWQQQQADREQRQGLINEYNAAVDSGDTAAQQKSLAKLAPELMARFQQQQNQWQQQNAWEQEKLQKQQEFLERQAYLQNAMKGQSAYNTEMQKQLAKSESGKFYSEAMRPSVINALDRAEKAVNSGWGLGPIGARLTSLGINTGDESQKNYADVQSANTQMNTFLRQKLASTGLTGSELNSAVEAQAYRYTIDPSDPEGVVAQKIRNFRTDILGEPNGSQPKSLLGFNPKNANKKNEKTSGGVIDYTDL